MTGPFRTTGDLLATILWTVVTLLAVSIGVTSVPARTVFLLPLILLLPGYALVSLLYPDGPTSEITTESGWGWWRGPPIGLADRLGIAVAGSLAIVGVVAFGLALTVGLDRLLLSSIIGWLTVTLAAVAILVRLALPPELRFTPPTVNGVRATGDRYFRATTNDLAIPTPRTASTGVGVASNVLLVVGFIALVGSVGYAASVPPVDHAYTEFYLLAPGGDESVDGESLPRAFDDGTPQRIDVAIGNHEGRSISYTTVVQYDGREVDRFETTVPAGETERVHRRITLFQSSGDGTLTFLLYRDRPPATPTADTAYRVVRMDVTVGSSDGTGA